MEVHEGLHRQTGWSEMKLTSVGIDIAESVYQIHYAILRPVQPMAKFSNALNACRSSPTGQRVAWLWKHVAALMTGLGS